MSDSSERDRLDMKHARDRERRIQAIKRWIAYIESEPPERWGPQQNAVVNGQLDAANAANLPASHRRAVKERAAELDAKSND